MLDYLRNLPESSTTRYQIPLGDVRGRLPWSKNQPGGKYAAKTGKTNEKWTDTTRQRRRREAARKAIAAQTARYGREPRRLRRAMGRALAKRPAVNRAAAGGGR